MHRAVVGPAHQGQVREVGGVAVQPVAEMMGLAPAQGPVSRLAMAPTIVTSSPSRIQTVPSPITTSQ
jgi:hypothetical protein